MFKLKIVQEKNSFFKQMSINDTVGFLRLFSVGCLSGLAISVSWLYIFWEWFSVFNNFLKSTQSNSFVPVPSF